MYTIMIIALILVYIVVGTFAAIADSRATKSRDELIKALTDQNELLKKAVTAAGFDLR